MTEKEIMKQINDWCDYFIQHPFLALYQKGDYKDYKQTVELFNSFLSNKEAHAPIDSEEIFNSKVEILNCLVKEGYLHYVEKEN